MSTTNRPSFRSFIVGTLLFMGMSLLPLHAQYYISGPTSVTQGQTYQYYIANLGGSYSSVSWYSPYGGVVTSAYGNIANVRWDYAGSSSLLVNFYSDYNYYYLQLSPVTVTGTAPTNPPNPTVSDASPGSVTLLRTGTPPTGVTWYWQESASGTSTANGSSATKTVTSGSIYYLKAYNGTTWSPGSGSVPYTIPTTPSNENYIYSVTPRKAVTTIGSLANNERVEGFTYFDGLGRPMQGVGVRAGGNNEDILTHIEYDQYGRQDKEYLPYSSSSSIGLYRSTALSATKGFYDQAKYDADFLGMTTSNINPFVEKSLEPSPLGRIQEQGAPGMDWLVNKTSNSDHTVKFEYKTNASGEVRYYGVSLSYANNTYTPTLTGGGSNNYGAGTLTKTITKDENWTSGTDRTTEEFKDKEGRVVLVRKYNGGEKHDTYHIYNNHGTLSYVLPPKVDAGNTSFSLATINSRLDELAYQFKYDNRKRIVEKKSPGKEWEYIVYDKLDRPVLTQDGNQRVPSTDEWLFTKYDIFGRVIYTGTYDSNSSRTSLQSTFDAKTAAQNYEAKVTSGTGYDSTYYTNNGFPTTSLEVLAVNYYDDYTFGGFSAMPYSVEGQLVLNYNNDVSTRKHMKGLATGSKIKILDTSSWTTTYIGYDGKGRAIYSKSVNNYLGTTDIVQNKLDFTGAVEKTLAAHSRTGGHSTITTEDLFTYDHMGRLKKQTQEINDNNVLEVIAENTFDDLGQLKGKKVGGKSTENRLQDVNYTYNVRSWLKGINNESGSNSSITLGSGDLFGFQINHNNPSTGGTALFNGNISQTLWKTTSVNPSPYYAVSNKYTYTYDALNRLLTATDNTGHYNVSNLAYDKNGNIMSLTRNGWKGSADFNNMDVLDYDYFGSEISNKLYKVRDDGSDTYGYKDSAVDDQDYWYDVNGNLTKDDNKEISSITYYHFNLPKKVTFTGTNRYIDYIYDANGVKLKRTVTDNTNVIETFYAGDYVYENSSLKFFNQPEGYIVKSGSNFEYIYQYKDHLGNIRLSYKDVNRNNVSAISLQIQEENNYYPFGLKHEGYNNAPLTNHPYKYNGVELNTGLGLNLYEMDVRSYDPAIARFTSLDPVTRFEFSPYSAFDNNPVFWADPSGATPETTYFGAVDFMGRDRYNRWGDFIPPNARTAGEPIDRINIDTKNNTVHIVKTDDDYDEVYKDGKLVERTEKGKQKPEDFHEEGYDVFVLSATGMGAVDFVFLSLAGEKLLQWIGKGIWSLWASRTASKGVGQLGFKEVQTLTKTYSNELNAFFKSGGSEMASKEGLQAYKELATRILNGTGGAPATKLTETALKVQTQRLEMINKALEIFK